MINGGKRQQITVEWKPLYELRVSADAERARAQMSYLIQSVAQKWSVILSV